MINVARLHLGQGTLSTRLPFQDRMVGVSTLNLQKKCILVAEKSCYLQEQSSKLFFSLREFLFSLIKLFFFSIWTVKTSLRSVLTTIQISKKKNLIAENKNSLSEKKLRLRALFFQSNVFPATRNIYSTTLGEKNLKFCLSFRENSRASPCYFQWNSWKFRVTKLKYYLSLKF